jgi:hypothetical protein
VGFEIPALVLCPRDAAFRTVLRGYDGKRCDSMEYLENEIDRTGCELVEHVAGTPPNR